MAIGWDWFSSLIFKHPFKVALRKLSPPISSNKVSEWLACDGGNIRLAIEPITVILIKIKIATMIKSNRIFLGLDINNILSEYTQILFEWKQFYKATTILIN